MVLGVDTLSLGHYPICLAVSAKKTLWACSTLVCLYSNSQSNLTSSDRKLMSDDAPKLNYN